MPTLTRWAIKTALLWAALAVVVGVLLAWPGAPALPYPTYLHLLTVGWLSNLIFGVAHWMFPRASAGAPRGDVRPAWSGYLLLNAGLLARIVAEAFGPSFPGPWLLLSAFLQVAAVWCWVIHLWPRVKVR